MREHPELLEERFGPVVLLLTYGSRDELLDALVRIDGQLTGSVHAQAQDADLVALLAAALGERSGRLIFDGFPTGVAVTHGMHHGGPFPATTAPAHTSVGMTAIRRFLRPVAFQNAPAHVLPPELQDANPLGIWRRVDGELTRDALGSVVDDAHRDARRARGVGERQEVAHRRRCARRTGSRAGRPAPRGRRRARPGRRSAGRRASRWPGARARDEAVGPRAREARHRLRAAPAPSRRSRAGRTRTRV